MPIRASQLPECGVAHPSPLRRVPVDLTGAYVWGSQQSMSENIDGPKPPRATPG
jgi:hypothetical protein